MRILYATDGSPGAGAAEGLLAHLALTPRDVVRILLVRASDDAPARDVPSLVVGNALAEREARTGAPAEVILAEASKWPADMILLGAQGSGGGSWGRGTIGKVADRVLRQAQAPVLVARPLQHSLRHVMIGVDPSDTGKQVAASAAALLPLPQDTELCLATVVPHQAAATVAPAVWAALSGEMTNLLDAPLEAAETRLRDVAQVIGDTDRPIRAEVLRGDPASALVTAAANQQADLLVVGNFRAPGMDRLVLGTVPDQVARNASCSVLVVR